MNSTTASDQPTSVSNDRPPLPLMLTEKEVADLLRVSIYTVKDWRRDGRSPPQWKVLHGKIIRYPSGPFVEWINRRDACDEVPRARARDTSLPTTASGVPENRDDEGFNEPMFYARRQKRSWIGHSKVTENSTRAARTEKPRMNNRKHRKEIKGTL